MMHLTLQQLSAHLDEALQGASLQAVERHLSACEACRDELAALTMQDEVLATVLRGESDPKLFELITLQVLAAIHPQKARDLQKRIKTLELARAEHRLRAETQALSDADERRVGFGNLDDGLTGEPPAGASSAPPAHPQAFEATDARGGSVGHQKRALEEARKKAEDEARAHELETQRAREEVEQRALEAARDRARGGRDARRRREAAEERVKSDGETRRKREDDAREREEQEAKLRAEVAERRRAEEAERLREEGERARQREEREARLRAEEAERARKVAAARAEAEALATVAADAMAEAESSAHDAALARLRAEARAAAADAARRDAEAKAAEANRLAATGVVSWIAGGESAAVPLIPSPDAGDDPFLPSTLEPRSGRAAPRGPRHGTARSHARRRRSSFPLAAAAAVLLAAFGGWFLFQHRDLFGLARPGGTVEAVVGPKPEQAVPAEPAEPAGPAEPAEEAPAAMVSSAGHAAPHNPAPHSATTDEEVAAPTSPMDGFVDTEAAPAAETPLAEEPHHAAANRRAPARAPQTGLVCGFVRDENQHPVPGARVMVAQVGVAVVTDRTGRFCFAAPKGQHVLSVLAIGFRTQRHDVNIGRQLDDLILTLHASSAAPGDPTH